MYDITEKDNNIIINTKNDKKFKRVYKDLIITSKYNNLCNEIFRKNLYDFDNPVFTKKINYGEDIIVNLSLFSKAKKILFTNDIFYHYFINDKSITNNINVNNIKKNIYDNIFLNEERIKYLNIYDIKDINEYMVRSRIVDFIYGQLIKYIINSKIINYDEIINCLDDNAIYRSITFDNDSLLLNGNIYEKSVKEAIINKKYVKLRFLLLLLKPVRIIKKIKK